MVCATFYHGLAEIPAPDGGPGSDIINEGLNFRQWEGAGTPKTGYLIFLKNRGYC